MDDNDSSYIYYATLFLCDRMDELLEALTAFEYGKTNIWPRRGGVTLGEVPV